MSREILFRAWSEKRQVLEEVNVSDGKAVRKGYQWFNTDNDMHDSKLEQFCGLLDKNGVKIFEGDVINYIFDSVIFHNTGDFVCFQNGYFGISRPNKNTKYIPVICDAKNIEVIGNIHDNKNLLEN